MESGDDGVRAGAEAGAGGQAAADAGGQAEVRTGEPAAADTEEQDTLGLVRERCERAVEAAVALIENKAEGWPGRVPADAPARRAMGELDVLEATLRVLVPVDDALLALVRSRLGRLYVRCCVADPTPAERRRALALLRDARGSGALDDQERHRAAAHLCAMLMRPYTVAGWEGSLEQLSAMAEMGRSVAAGESSLPDDLAEVRALMPELLEHMPEHAAELRRSLDALTLVSETLTGRNPDGWKDVLSIELPQGAAVPAGLTGFISGARSLLGDGAQRAAENMQEAARKAAGGGALDPETAVALETANPGTIRSEDLDTVVDALTSRGPSGAGTAVDSLLAGLARALQGLRDGNPETLVKATGLLDDAVAKDAMDAKDVMGAMGAEDAKDAEGAGNGDGFPGWLSQMMAPGVLLTGSKLTGGALADLDAGLSRLDVLFAPGSDASGSPFAQGRSWEELRLLYRWMGGIREVETAVADADAERLHALDDEVNARVKHLDSTLQFAFMPYLLLITVQLALFLLEGEAERLRKAVDLLARAERTPKLPSFARRMLGPLEAMLLAACLHFEPDPERLSAAIERSRTYLDGPSVVPDALPRIRQGIALALEMRYLHDRDPATLDDAVDEYERAVAELTDATTRDTRQVVLWGRATNRRRRGDGARGDQAAALDAARRSLELIAEDVLLQLGVEHGLEIARGGASRGLVAASWAAADGDVEAAVELLEAGRTLVLRAAAAEDGVARQLVARGEPELAEQWRAALRDQPGPGPAGSRVPMNAWEARAQQGEALMAGATAGITIPSTLRRRALEALSRPSDGAGEDGVSDSAVDGASGAASVGASASASASEPASEPASGAGSEAGRGPLRALLSPSGVAELRAGVADAGADALVYLLPGQDGGAGTALLLPRTGEPRAVPLPGLGADGAQPLERYLDAAALRSVTDEHDPRAQEAHHTWSAALDDLCDWAGHAVMAEVVDAVAAADEDFGPVPAPAPGADGAPAPEAPSVPSVPVRLVLVPCGNLGVVPWHAARLPVSGAPGTGVGAGPGGVRAYRYACERAVISYAASGGEFLRAAARRRMCGSGAGRQDGPAVLVADPLASLMFAEEEVDALRAYHPDALLYGCHRSLPRVTGTPEDVLSHLPGGEGRPAALLHLVAHGRADRWATSSAVRLADGGGRLARLTVARVLDVRAAGEPEASGPLVVLSACETDLSARDHDEALTPTTAFVARGASDAVGTRWKVPDIASAPIMVVFHHYLTDKGLAPPDALRAAQLWMLDPDREPVRGFTPDLLRLVAGDTGVLASLPAWAGFIHQGNPRPAPAPARAGEAA